LPVLDADHGAALERATAAVHSIPARYAEYWQQGFRHKLGLQTIEATDHELAQGLLQVMQAERADFTNTFRNLAAAATNPDALTAPFSEWRQAWLARLAREAGGVDAAATQLRRSNPAYIPRNHRIEAVIAAAVARNDFAPFHALHAVLARPFADQPGQDVYREPPLPQERVQNTFCGT
jgi:serine/tyrosine/threonine adenylyltransferase